MKINGNRGRLLGVRDAEKAAKEYEAQGLFFIVTLGMKGL